jgi:hypothetical protein
MLYIDIRGYLVEKREEVEPIEEAGSAVSLDGSTR